MRARTSGRSRIGALAERTTGAAPIIGVLVGGAGRRMGGIAKGRLSCDGIPLIERVVRAARSAAEASGGSPDDVFLVGENDDHALDGVTTLPDRPAGVGPIGGLRALLDVAAREGRSAIALAVDMPFVSPAVLGRLAVEQPEAAALAPRTRDRWEPLFARYRPERVRPVVESLLSARELSLQRVFHRLGSSARELRLSPEERASLVDWDRPSDVTGEYPKRHGS